MAKNIVLLHGWGAETKKLEPLGRELKKLGWSVYIPKLIGFEKPAPVFVWGIKEYSDYVKDEASAEFGEYKYYLFSRPGILFLYLSIFSLHCFHLCKIGNNKAQISFPLF